MKKTIPFSKEMPFKTRIAEITDIEVTHNLEKTDENTIEGSFLVNGTYKMTEASQIEEKFSYDLPFIIEVDAKYDLDDAKIKISDFYFEIINEDILKINIEVELDNIQELKTQDCDDLFEELELDKVNDFDDDVPEVRENVEKQRCYDEEDKEEVVVPLNDIKEDIATVEPIDIMDKVLPKKLEVDNKTEIKQTSQTRPITDIFTSINDVEDNFKTYHVHIVRETDTIESILNTYQITRDMASEYNDLNEVKIGSKLILPCSCKDE